MAQPPLRVYYGPEQAMMPEACNPPAQVRVSLSDILPALVEAGQKKKSWVNDLGDEEITISEDLYEVIMAYQSFFRPSA